MQLISYSRQFLLLEICRLEKHQENLKYVTVLCNNVISLEADTCVKYYFLEIK